MARLSIEQIKAPNLSVASQATARAGESFQQGISNAAGLLKQYQDGQEAQGDAELTNLLAGAKTEEEWNQKIDGLDFNSMNISDAKRNEIINRRGTLLDWEGSRADTGLTGAQTDSARASAASTRAGTSRANTKQGWDQEDRDYGILRRDEDSAGAVLAAAAARENKLLGDADPAASSSPVGQLGPQIPVQGAAVNTDGSLANRPAQAALNAYEATRKTQTTAEALQSVDIQSNYAALGEVGVTAAQVEQNDESMAKVILDLSRNQVDPTEAVMLGNKNIPGKTAKEKLQNSAKLLAETGDGGALSAARLTLGLTGAPPDSIGTADSTLADIKEAQTRDPFKVAMNAAATYTDNPAGMMTDALEGLGVSAKPSDIESAINELAASEGISRAEAAYSYARAAETESRLGRVLSIGGDNLSNQEAAKFARENFSSDGAAKSRAALADDARKAKTINDTTEKLGRISKKIQRLQGNGDTVPNQLLIDQAALVKEVDSLYDQYGNKGQPAGPLGGRPAVTAPAPGIGADRRAAR
jgi:hypothetical protein